MCALTKLVHVSKHQDAPVSIALHVTVIRRFKYHGLLVIKIKIKIMIIIKNIIITIIKIIIIIIKIILIIVKIIIIIIKIIIMITIVGQAWEGRVIMGWN